MVEALAIDTQVDREVDSNGMYLIKVYKEIKENGITKEIREVWTITERTKQLRQNETPYDSMRAMINAFRETINYMMTSKMHVDRRTIDLDINVTQLEKSQKCYKCVEVYDPNRVNHKWYDCFYNPKSGKYKGKDKYSMNTKVKSEKSRMNISVARYNKMKGLIKNVVNNNPVQSIEKNVQINTTVAQVQTDMNIDTTESSESE